MAKKFLLGCSEFPNEGGAGTTAYRIFQDLQQQGLDVSLVIMVSRESAIYRRAVYGDALGNERGLANVHTLILERAPFYPTPAHENLARLIAALAPDTLIGVDFIATLLLKSSAPDRRMLFITAGCDQAKHTLVQGRAHSVTEILAQIETRRASRKFHLPAQILGPREAQAVACADLVLLHAEMMRTLYAFYFPAHAVKLFSEIVWLTEWIVQDAMPYRERRKPFAERTVDVLFVASDWSRPEKNWDLARALILRHPDWNIHIVGRSREQVGRATYHGVITDRAALFALMGNARVVASPSRLDAAPGVLFEAVVMGCNIVASKNCGNWELCHPALLADALSEAEYSQRIQSALVREYWQNLERFLEVSARETLVEILQVF